MKMKKYSTEFKVGIFVILCILGLFYLTYSTGKLNFKKEGYHIYALFNDAAGLKENAPVMLNGLEVGKVEEMKFSYDNDKTQIMLKLWLDKAARVRENPLVSIKTLGLMGEKYVQISSGAGKGFVGPEAVLYGSTYLDLDALIQQAQNLSKDLTQQINKLITNIDATLGENKNSISGIIKNLEATSKNFEEFSSDLKRHPWKLLFKTKEKPAKPQAK